MKKLLLIPVFGISVLTSVHAYEIDYIKKEVTQQALKFNVPAEFALAIIKVESGYNPKVRGVRGEIGLGQISCQTAKSLGFTGNCDRLYHTETNLEFTMKYLKMALDRSNGNQCHAATLYSSGLDRKPSSSEFCQKVMAAIKKI